MRAWILGCCGVMIVAGITYYNDYLLKQTFFVGNHMPAGVFGLLIVLTLLNTLWLLYRRQGILKAREWAILIMMMSTACAIPASGLMRYFTASLIVPRFQQKVKPQWQRLRIVDQLAPPQLLVQPFDELGSYVLEQPLHGSQVRIAYDLANKKLPPASELLLRVEDPATGERRLLRIQSVSPSAQEAVLFEAVEFRPGMRITLLHDQTDNVVTPFIQGQGDHVEVPWRYWLRPLLWWSLILVSIWLCLSGISVIVHRQWRHHEQLPYPLAEFTSALIRGGDEKGTSIFYARSFWIGFGIVLAVYLNNYLWAWVPKLWVRIPLAFDFRSLMEYFHLENVRPFAQPRFYFSAIAFACFLAEDVSFSIGIAPLLHHLLFGLGLPAWGIDINKGKSTYVKYRPVMDGGAFVGMMLMLLYIGRRYYTNVIRRIFGLAAHDAIPESITWWGRFAMLGGSVFVITLKVLGLGVFDAVLYLLVLLTFFVIMSRILAETGMFFIQPDWWPSALLVALLGPSFFGAGPILLLFIVGNVFIMGSRETFMPYLLNNLAVAEKHDLTPGKSAGYGLFGVILAFLIALPVTLSAQYRFGVNFRDGWGTKAIPALPYENAAPLFDHLKTLDKFQFMPDSLQRWLQIAPIDSRYWLWFLTGALLVIGVSLLRIYIPRWPLHPVIFLVWFSTPVNHFAGSFLLGWFVKKMIMHYGGARVWQRIKPFFFGLIAGEIAAAFLAIVAGWLYYFITHDRPAYFNIFPA